MCLLFSFEYYLRLCVRLISSLPNRILSLIPPQTLLFLWNLDSFQLYFFFFPPLLLYMERWHSGKILASLFITHLMDRIKYIFNLFLFFPKELWKVKCRNICLIWHKFINKLINKIDCLQLTEMFRDSSVKCVCASYTHRIYMIWLCDKIGDKKK